MGKEVPQNPKTGKKEKGGKERKEQRKEGRGNRSDSRKGPARRAGFRWAARGDRTPDLCDHNAALCR
jgi:hypothetical protein